MRLYLLLLLAIGACRPVHIQSPPLVEAGDGGSVCERAASVIVANHCDGITNYDALSAACLRDQAQGSASQLDPQCILDASSTAEMCANCNVCCTVGGTQ